VDQGRAVALLGGWGSRRRAVLRLSNPKPVGGAEFVHCDAAGETPLLCPGGTFYLGDDVFHQVAKRSEVDDSRAAPGGRPYFPFHRRGRNLIRESPALSTSQNRCLRSAGRRLVKPKLCANELRNATIAASAAARSSPP